MKPCVHKPALCEEEASDLTNICPCAAVHPVVKHLDAGYYLNQSTVQFYNKVTTPKTFQNKNINLRKFYNHSIGAKNHSVQNLLGVNSTW